MNRIYRRSHGTFISIQSIDPDNRKVRENNIIRHRFRGFTRIKDKKELIFMENFKHHDITEKIIGAAYKVHNNLGSGFLEKVYQNSLAIELRSLDFLFDIEKSIKVHYKGEID